MKLKKKHSRDMIINEKAGDVMATENQKALKRKETLKAIGELCLPSYCYNIIVCEMFQEISTKSVENKNSVKSVINCIKNRMIWKDQRFPNESDQMDNFGLKIRIVRNKK